VKAREKFALEIFRRRQNDNAKIASKAALRDSNCTISVYYVQAPARLIALRTFLDQVRCGETGKCTLANVQDHSPRAHLLKIVHHGSLYILGFGQKHRISNVSAQGLRK